MPQSTGRTRRHPDVAAVFLAAATAIAFVSVPGAGMAQIVIGGDGGNDAVTVNQDVLNSLGGGMSPADRLPALPPTNLPPAAAAPLSIHPLPPLDPAPSTDMPTSMPVSMPAIAPESLPEMPAAVPIAAFDQPNWWPPRPGRRPTPPAAALASADPVFAEEPAETAAIEVVAPEPEPGLQPIPAVLARTPLPDRRPNPPPLHLAGLPPEDTGSATGPAETLPVTEIDSPALPAVEAPVLTTDRPLPLVPPPVEDVMPDEGAQEPATGGFDVALLPNDGVVTDDRPTQPEMPDSESIVGGFAPVMGPPTELETPTTDVAAPPPVSVPEIPEIVAELPPTPTGPAPELGPMSGAEPEASPGSRQEFMTITLDPLVEELPESATTVLDDLADQLLADETLRVQVLSYAGGAADGASAARLMSLNRALEVRTFLMERDIRRTRIDVRALGDTAPAPPSDRIDLVISN